MMFIEFKKISQAKFERSIGVSNGYLNNLRRSPSAEVLQKIFSSYPELNQDWLLTGEGDMLNPEGGVNGNYVGGSVGGNNQQSVTMGSDVSDFIEIIKRQSNQIDRLLAVVESQQSVIARSLMEGSG